MAAVIKSIITVFLGALLGASLRLSSEWLLLLIPADCSLLIINSLGCAAFAIHSHRLKAQQAKLFWLTGCWGTYTSFSAVSAALLLIAKTETQGLAGLFAYGGLTLLTWWLGFAVGKVLAVKNDN